MKLGNFFASLNVIESVAEALDSFVSFPASDAGYKGRGSDYSNNPVLARAPVEARKCQLLLF